MRFFLLVFLAPFFLFAENLETTVSSDEAHFENDHIVLEGHVSVSNESLNIHSQKALMFRDEEKQTRLEFPWIELKEEVSAIFYNKYFLKCFEVHIDYLTKNIHFFGRDQKIFFQEAANEVYADKALLDFVEDNGKFIISKIILIGNIEMRSREEKSEKYAIADMVECFPEQEILFLKADNGKRVLFFDKTNNITISAESVKGQRVNGKDCVEGIGDVRLTFKNDEIEKLKQKFEIK